MKPVIDAFRYRPEIDGLRALAVIAVVLYHAGFGCTGGYIGVDVFFVISGYLITSLIWKDLETGKFTFAHFWERRARRIVPALVVTTIAVLVAGWFILLPSDFASLGRATASQAVFAANIHYWQDSGYFAGIAEEKPLLHTWSLAVEEQFYLIVPFLFWAAYRFVRLRSRTAILSLLAAAGLFSFAVAVYGVAKHPQASFYLLPTRAWELLLGAFVAFSSVDNRLLKLRWLREAGSLVGLALVLVSTWFYTITTPFPGIAALVPCVGTALLIWTNGRRDATVPTVIGRMFTWKPLVFVGLISYSLYLWHWPFFAYARYMAIEPLPVATRLILVVAGFALAVLSWRFVETPFREKQIAKGNTVFRYAGAGLVAVLAGGLIAMGGRGFPDRYPIAAQRFEAARAEGAAVYSLSEAQVRAGDLVPMGVKDESARPAVLIWGDSHAMSAMPAFDAYLKSVGLRGVAATHPSTAPIVGWHIVARHGLGAKADAFNKAVIDYVKRNRVQHVVMAGFWTGYTTDIGDGYGAFAKAMVDTVRLVREAGAQPWILVNVPKHPFDVPKTMSRSIVGGFDVTSYLAKPDRSDPYGGIRPETLREVERAGGRVMDPRPLFVTAPGEPYRVEKDEVVLYRDEHHLTPAGSKLMLVPLLRHELALGAKAPPRPR